MQLNAINRLQRYMGSQEMKAIIKGFIYANFNCCLLVWHFCSCKCCRKVKQIQKRCLKIIFDDYRSDYETLLEKGKTSTVVVKTMRIIDTEIIKTINHLNSSFMKDNFTSKLSPKVQSNNLIVKRHNTTKYRTKSLTTIDPQIWNTLRENIKSEICYCKLKKNIHTWFGSQCNCNYCKN